MDTINLENIKGVIFDLDGVIFNIIGAIRQAVEDTVEKYQITVNIEDVLQDIALLIEKLQNFPIPKIILNSFDLLQVRFLDGMSFFKKLRVGIYLFNQFNTYKEDAKIYDGIKNLILKLAETKKLAILTNNKNTHAEEVLKRFDLAKYFKLIIGFNEVTEVKPSPEGINKILKEWNLKPSEVVFIGDMTTDVMAGKAANVNMVAVYSGLARKESLKENNPNYFANDTQELQQLFNQ